MRLAFIVSIPMLRKLDIDTGYHLVLPHLYKDRTYFDFYSERASKGDWIIQDNSSHEFRVNPPEFDLLLLAEEMNASEVVIPEILFNHTATKQLQEFFITKNAYRKGNKNWLAVVQGSCWVEFLDSYLRIVHDKYIDTIGIAYGYPFDAYGVWNEGLKQLGWNRFSLIHRLINDGYWRFNKQHHLFGLYNPGEISLYPFFFPQIGNIRGNDSSNAFWCASYGLQYSSNLGTIRKIEIPVDFNCLFYNDLQYSTFCHNKDLLCVYASGKERATELIKMFINLVFKEGVNERNRVRNY